MYRIIRLIIQDREHIETEYARIPDAPRGMFFSGFQTHRQQYQSAPVPRKGEASNHRHANHRRETTGKRRIANRPVAPTRPVPPFENTNDHRHRRR